MPCCRASATTFSKKSSSTHLRGRVRREADDHHLGLRDELADRALGLGEEVHARRHAHRADVGAGDDRAVDVDRVARVGHQHRVAAVERGEHQVREAFLGADGDDRLAVHVEVHVPAALVPLADGAAQARDALRDRVAVGVLALRHLHQLVDDVAAAWARRGCPCDRSMMSSPARRAAIFSSLVMLKTYGGRRLMRENSGTMGFEVSFRFMSDAAVQNDYDSSECCTQGWSEALKIERDAADGRNAFTGYGEGYVEVNRTRHHASLVVSAERVVTDWPAASRRRAFGGPPRGDHRAGARDRAARHGRRRSASPSPRCLAPLYRRASASR